MDVQVPFRQQIEAYGFVPLNHDRVEFFDVEVGGIYDTNGRQIPNYQRVYRGDTGDTLGVHTATYSMVPYRIHTDLIEKALIDSSLPTDDLVVKSDMADNGAKVFTQYLLPSTTEVIQATGQERPFSLRIVTWDSYDGSSAFKARAGAFDWVCANESVRGNVLANVSVKHTGSLSERVAKAAGDMVKALEDHFLYLKRVQAWTQRIIQPWQASELLEALPQSNKTLVNELTARFARENGSNLFDFWSMLTAWSTHDLSPKTRSDRQKRVADLVEGKDWKVVEPA